MAESPPFFIVGSARSGTTFLRLTMNAHPEIAVPPESRFVTELHEGPEEVRVDDFLARLAGHKRFEAWGLPIEAVRDELAGLDRAPYAEAIDATYRAYAKAQGKNRWGDKTPRYVENIPELAALFPDCRFIHLIRDGRDVALSYADVPFGPKNVAKAAELWADRVARGMRDGRVLERGRYIEIMYTDLVEDNEGEVKDICAFVGVPFDPIMLDTSQTQKGALARAEKYNPNVTEQAIRRVRSWKTDMPPAHVEIFEAIAGDVLSELGFERRYPNPSAAARLKAKAGIAGLPVAKIRSLATT
ncbi:MAG TPA: sulfotransferase [Actinomycetota bacterium]|nr:sulfotransferase [Actinomycetota bacterium]